jgi:hypothetical protein
MANLVTSWRQALAADLAVQFPNAEMEAGHRTGTSRDKDRIAVFWPGLGEQQGRVVVGEAQLIVRYWPKNPMVRDAGSPMSPSELEQAAWDLADFLQTKQTSYSATGVWFCRLVSCRPDYDPDEWGVEAIVVAQFTNPAVV